MTEREDAIDLLHRAAEAADKGSYIRSLANVRAASILIAWEAERPGQSSNPRMRPIDKDDFDS